MDEERDNVGSFVPNASPVEARRIALVMRFRIVDLAGEGEDGRDEDEVVSDLLGGVAIVGEDQAVDQRERREGVETVLLDTEDSVVGGGGIYCPGGRKPGGCLEAERRRADFRDHAMRYRCDVPAEIGPAREC